jgi:hypothetical protein
MNTRNNTIKIIILVTGMIVGIISVYAETGDTTKIYRKAQATFAHPIGTNGDEAPQVVNNFSFNLLYGISGGVNGAEIGLLINNTTGSVRGFQFGGIGNSVSGSINGFQATAIYNIGSGNITGVQFAGITNIIRNNMNGATVSGITNIISGDTKGFVFAGLGNNVAGMSGGFQGAGLYNLVEEGSNGAQFAGLSNINLKDTRGAYFAGLANILNGDSKGAQFAGLSNVNTGRMNGAQIAGLANVNIEDIEGAQIAGLANLAVETSQTQIAGLANVVVEESRGLQLAGLANVSPREHRGAQIAGLVNYTRRMNGFQLALVNVSDTVKRGVPIGFISIVARGYRRFEIDGNEVLYINASFKTGTTKFYNIFSIGYRPDGDKQHWGVTYGIGTMVPISTRFNFNVDLTATHLNEDEAWTKELNLLNRLKFNASYRITKRLEVFGGPSLNVAVSKLRNAEGELIGSSIVPSYGFYDENVRGTNVKMYIGFNLGIRF